MGQEQKVCATRCPLPPSKEERVHVLPCRIKYDGNAPVSTYFVVDENKKQARFRGVELQGDFIDVHELEYAGLVIADDGLRDTNEFTEEESPVWEVESQFATLIDWETKDCPSNESLKTRIATWTQYSNALHGDE